MTTTTSLRAWQYLRETPDTNDDGMPRESIWVAHSILSVRGKMQDGPMRTWRASRQVSNDVAFIFRTYLQKGQHARAENWIAISGHKDDSQTELYVRMLVEDFFRRD
ncbi:MAG: hypothetical protein SGPRY_007929 [Prymnesium sp.]